MQLLNIYDHHRTNKVKGTIQLCQWASLIKESKDSNKIQKARATTTDIEYNSIKASVPAVTYNFLYNKEKSTLNTTSNTGLLFFDVDDSNFQLDSLDRSKIALAYKSFGGKGYHIIVQVDGLNINNYTPTYDFIEEKIGLKGIADKGAKKPTQFAVLSHDPEVYYNPESFVFPSIENVPSSIVYPSNSITSTIELGTQLDKVRFTDKFDFEVEGMYMVNWETGYNVIETFIPIYPLKDGRKVMLFNYCRNYVYLNPFIKFDSVLSTMYKVQSLGCDKPVGSKILTGIVKSIFQMKDENRLEPYYTNRHIIFSKDCGLNREEKLEVCRIELAKMKTENSKEKLYKTIEQWDFATHGKITQRKLVTVGKFGKNTVSKYVKQFQEYINEQNNANK